jgi:hypothetical protein
MSYNEQLQRIVKKYEDAGNTLPATAHDISAARMIPKHLLVQQSGEPLLFPVLTSTPKISCVV